jgi:hypothetical protein
MGQRCQRSGPLPLPRLACRLRPVAARARNAEVGGVVAAAARDGDDVVDLVATRVRAGSAAQLAAVAVAVEHGAPDACPCPAGTAGSAPRRAARPGRAGVVRAATRGDEVRAAGRGAWLDRCRCALRALHSRAEDRSAATSAKRALSARVRRCAGARDERGPGFVECERVDAVTTERAALVVRRRLLRDGSRALDRRLSREECHRGRDLLGGRKQCGGLDPISHGGQPARPSAIATRRRRPPPR